MANPQLLLAELNVGRCNGSGRREGTTDFFKKVYVRAYLYRSLIAHV